MAINAKVLAELQKSISRELHRESPQGSLTPILGDRKVENFLGIKRKYELGKMGLPKKPRSCILLDPGCSKEQRKIQEIEKILEEEAKY
ncbi:hypothetical protein Tco_1473828 [Tanacetum coccineum]